MNFSLGIASILLLFIAIFLRRAQGGCPAGQTRLDACIGGECPNPQEAGRVYVCIGDDCCAQNQTPIGGNCNDVAINCILFISNCRTPMYINCMIANCARTCGFCNAGTG